MDENDIRPKFLEIEHKKVIKNDVMWLKEKQKNFSLVCCPSCGSNNYKYLYKKYFLTQVLCKDCNTQFVNPRPTEKILKEFYSRSVNYEFFAKNIFSRTEEVRLKKIFMPRAKYLSKKIDTKGKTLLEIGAAYGFFVEAVKKLKLFKKIIAVEPTPDLAAKLRKKNNLVVIEKAYENIVMKEKVDVVANFEVIEHLYNPKKFLKWCYDITKPNGCIFLTCPNISGFETTVLGKFSTSVDHEHLNMFNPNSISLLLKNVGFKFIEVTTPGKLDVDLVRSALDKKNIKSNALGGFLQQLYKENNTKKLKQFQNFLSSSGESSHMMILAYKK
ncbi:MAG: methyltransferase type 11 [Rhodospirillaceae bacterium]|nr:methyltransferase type 11 [Rhodospirillaceae bacterium]